MVRVLLGIEPPVFNVDKAFFEKISVGANNRLGHGPKGSAAKDKIGLVALVQVCEHHRCSFAAAKGRVRTSDLEASSAAGAVFVDGRQSRGNVSGEETRSHRAIGTSSG